MSATTEIFETWRRPAQVMRRKLDRGVGEEHALILLFAACFLFYVAQWPRLSREAHLGLTHAQEAGLPLEEVPGIQALLGINLFAFLFMVPLIFYAVAALSRLILRLFRAKIDPLAARIALFQALLCTAPLMLFQGLLAGFSGPGLSVTAVGVGIALAFLWLWSQLLREAMR